MGNFYEGFQRACERWPENVAAELQRDWRQPTGQALGRVFHDHYQSYGLLMDSFESAAANAVKKAS